MTHSLSTLSSDPLDWPIYVNFQKGYRVGYPRELIIRELSTADVEFDLPGTSYQAIIHMAVIQDSTVSSLEKWVRENYSYKVSIGESHIENLRKLTIQNLPAVEFFSKSKICFEECTSESFRHHLVVKKDIILISFSCEKCPSNIESIWHQMVGSFQPISNNYIQPFTGTESQAYSNIALMYPKEWFYKPITPEFFMISSFNTEGFFTGSYKGGISIDVARCNLTFAECIKDIGIKGTDLLDQDLIQSLGGVVETIDTPTMKGIIYGQMDPIKYQARSTLHTIIMVNKQNGTTVILNASLSLFGGHFELIKRIDSYYYPTLKMIAQNLQIL